MHSLYIKKIKTDISVPFFSRPLITACLSLLLLYPVQLVAQDITVPNTQQTTIQQAIDAITGTGIITILRGSYSESLIVKSDITLQGEETAEVKITSPDSSPAMDLTGINNVIIRNLSITSSSTGIQITNSTNISIHNNVFVLGTNAAPAGTAIDLLDTTSSAIIKQNTFFANNLAIKKTEDSVIKYNIFFNNTTALETGFGDSNTNLNCFDIGTGLGTNITEIDPEPPTNDLMFANQSLNDFHLQENSPCIDTIVEFNDAIDESTADMGAYGGTNMDLIPFSPQNINVSIDSIVIPHTVAITWDANLSYLVTNSDPAKIGGYQVHYDTDQPDINNPVYDGNEAGDLVTPVPSPVRIDTPDNTLTLEFLPSSLLITPEKPVISITPSSQTLDLSWPTVANASSYTVHYGINAITENTQDNITDTSFTITGLSNNETYMVAVSATHQPKIFIAITTFDNTDANPDNANISKFSMKDGMVIGVPVAIQSDTITAIPELIEPFPNLSGEGCFVATAAWGYYSAPQVQLLRDFRDRYLLTNKAGRLFVKWYYTHGPDAANYLNANPHFKPVVRTMLYPLIIFSQFMINTNLFIKSLIVVILLFAAILFVTMLVNKPDNKKYAWPYKIK